MNLLRYRPIIKTLELELPDGSVRKVKVTQNDAGTTQHVEDGNCIHGTGRLVPFAFKVAVPSKQRRPLLLKNLGMPKIRQAFARRPEFRGLWAPVPGTETTR